MDDRFAATVVRLGGYLSPFVFAGALLAIIVAGSKEKLTENLAAFLACMLILCPFCAVGSFLSLRRNMLRGAILRLLASGGVAIVMLSIVIASLAAEDCEDMVLNVFPCDHFFLQIMFYVLVLSAILLDILCSYRVMLLVSRGRLKDVLGVQEKPTPPPHPDNVDFTIEDPGEDGLSV